MSYARPHISAALQHLRHGVTILASVLVVCLLAHILIWAFLHFTDVAWLPVEVPEATPANAVVISDGAALKPEVPPTESRINPNQVLGSNGLILHRAADVTQLLGIIAAAGLAIVMLQGVAIAGGASVPGVEHVVASSTWTLLIAAFCLPLAAAFDELHFNGVFISFDRLVEITTAHREDPLNAPGALTTYGMHVILPLLMIVAAVAAVIRFRIGVEAGVIVTSMSQLDEKLEREISRMQLGKLASPRSVGALNAAIGADEPDPEPTPEPEPAPQPKSATPKPMTRRGNDSGRGNTGRPI